MERLQNFRVIIKALLVALDLFIKWELSFKALHLSYVLVIGESRFFCSKNFKKVEFFWVKPEKYALRLNHLKQ